MVIWMQVVGVSMQSISRTVGISFNAVKKMLINAGEACVEYHHQTVRVAHSRLVYCVEFRSFCYSENKNVVENNSFPLGAGDVWM